MYVRGDRAHIEVLKQLLFTVSPFGSCGGFVCELGGGAPAADLLRMMAMRVAVGARRRNLRVRIASGAPR